MSEPTHRLGAFHDDRAFLLTGVQVQGCDGAGKLERRRRVTPRGLGPCSRIVKRRTRLASAVN